MNAARCRIAGAGDSVKGWKRLFGFNRARVSNGLLDVSRGTFGASSGDGRLVCPWACLEGLWRHEPKLRTEDNVRPGWNL